MSTESCSSKARAVCQTCGFKGPHWLPKHPHLQLFQCSECESLSYLPQDDFDQQSLYTKRYFSGGEYCDYVGHRAVHEANAKNKWELLKPHLQAHIQLFEVGCAYGFFVNYVLNNGAERAYGVDVCVDAIDYARNSFGESFGLAADLNPPNMNANCLVAWDVWEHLVNPIEYFAKFLSYLVPGGIFALGTIDSASFVARIRGARWRQIHPPTHVHYPTKEGIARGMTSLGLEILEHRHIGHYRAFESYLAVLGLDKLVGSMRFANQLGKYPILLDLKDEQVIICRKPLGKAMI